MGLEEPIARRATDLLLQIKAGDVGAVVQYDELLFSILKEIASRRGRWMAVSAAGALGVGQRIGPPEVRSADLEIVASEAAQLALLRARSSALRFDPSRGDGASWAIGALGAAYVDTARNVTRSRRLLGEVPLEAEWVEHPSLTNHVTDPAHMAEVRDQLDRALALLSDDERFVVMARHHYGFSYKEIAELHFGDPNQTKAVDRLLQSGLRRLRDAHADWDTES